MNLAWFRCLLQYQAKNLLFIFFFIYHYYVLISQQDCEMTFWPNYGSKICHFIPPASEDIPVQQ